MYCRSEEKELQNEDQKELKKRIIKGDGQFWVKAYAWEVGEWIDLINQISNFPLTDKEIKKLTDFLCQQDWIVELPLSTPYEGGDENG